MLYISGHIYFVGNTAGVQVYFIGKIGIGILCRVQFAHQYFQDSKVWNQFFGNMMCIKEQIQIYDTVGLIIMPQIRNTCDGFLRIFVWLTGLLHILTGKQWDRLKLFLGGWFFHQFCDLCFA